VQSETTDALSAQESFRVGFLTPPPLLLA
jgi:hypothetical protein